MTAKPEIILSERDAERLEKLLDSFPANAFPGKADLEVELERAKIVDSKDIPPDVVTMNSKVKFRVSKFRVSSSDSEFCLTLVYPKDVDESGETISILAPVGSALLGLSRGDEIEWPKPGGGVLKVRIEDVLYQPDQWGQSE